MTAVARVEDPTVLWKGDPFLPPSEVEVSGNIWGTPRVCSESTPKGQCVLPFIVGADPSCPRSSVGPVVASVPRRNLGKLPSEGQSGAGVSDKDLGCQSPPRVVGSC